MLVRGIFRLLSVVAVVVAALPFSARAASFRPPFVVTYVGSQHSPWFHLAAGLYDVSERNRPLGCVSWAALAGTNGYHVVQLDPNFVPDVPGFHGGARWAGVTADLVAGTYRLEGKARRGCTWLMRLRRSGSSVRRGHAIITSTTRDGIRLSLTVPNSRYPRRALVSVTTRFTNVTHHTLWETPMEMGWCRPLQVLAVTLDGAGRALYPLPAPTIGMPECAAPRIFVLQPGRSIVQRQFVALLSPRLQARTQVNRQPRRRGFWGADLHTPLLTLQLIPARPLTVSLVRAPRLAVRVARPAGAHGPPFYLAWSTCRSARFLFWTRAGSDPIAAPCGGVLREWHLAAGWPGFPLGILNWKAKR